METCRPSLIQPTTTWTTRYHWVAQTQLSSASITWGYFGTNPIYVDNWSVLGRNGANQPWTTVAQGGFPNAASSSMGLETVATDLRLVAHSAQNNIGSYEFQLYGLPVGSVPVLTNLTATSNVPEDPIYCLARGYQASNLVDQNESTLAYPGGKTIRLYDRILGKRFMLIPFERFGAILVRMPFTLTLGR